MDDQLKSDVEQSGHEVYASAESVSMTDLQGIDVARSADPTADVDQPDGSTAVEHDTVEDMPPSVVLVPESPRAARALMVLSTVVFIVFALIYNFLTPFVSPSVLLSRDGGMTNPDEHEHFRYVQTVAETHRLPKFGENGNTEGHQPPLYYVAGAALYPPGKSVETAGHRVRLTSTVFGAMLLWVMFVALRELWPDKPFSAAITASIAAFVPMNVALCAAVNNDSLTNLIFATALFQLVRLSRRFGMVADDAKAWTRELVLLAVLLGGGVYVKMSAVMLFGVVAVFWLAAWRTGALPMAKVLRSLAVSAGLGLILALPWLVHNVSVSGDLLGTGAFVNVLQQHNFTPQQMIAQFGQQWYIKAMGWWTFESYWGVFDSMQLRLPNEVYVLLVALAVVALLGVPRWWSRNVTAAPAYPVAIASIALIVLNFAAFAQYNIHFFQAQGRYFLPSLLPLTTGFVGGLQAWAHSRYRRIVGMVLLAIVVLLNVVSLSLIETYFAGAIHMSR